MSEILHVAYKNKTKLYFSSANTKYISSCVLPKTPDSAARVKIMMHSTRELNTSKCLLVLRNHKLFGFAKIFVFAFSAPPV